MPEIDYSNIPGGKKVTITQNAPGATLYYYYYGTNGKNATTSSNSISFNIDRYAHVTAYSAGSSRKAASSPSVTAERTITVDHLAPPTFTVKMVGTGAYVTLAQAKNAVISYSLDGRTYQKYTKTLFLPSSSTVYAKASLDGYANSSVSSKTVTMTAPAAPTVSMLNTATKIAQGDAVALSWKTLENATEYTVKTYKDGVLLDTKSTTKNSLTVALTDVADYYFTVSAKNSFGESVASKTATVSAMAPVTVRFVDHDANVLSEQTVKYGGSAQAPPDPERRGYDFLYWDKSYTNVTSELTINAVYRIKTYRVTFLDQNDNRIGSVQLVQYLNSAVEPAAGSFDYPNGYAFFGWNVQPTDADSACDFTQVDSNMTVKAIVGWAEMELPLATQIISAKRNDSSEDGNYVVTVRINTTPEKYTTAMVRVSLKTAEGKMVKTEMHTVGLPAGTLYKDEEFVLNYRGTATVAEAVVLGYDGDYNTGSAYSEASTAPIMVLSEYVYGGWTDWQTAEPPANPDREVETKTQYRYRTKSTTTSSSSSLSGWTRYNTTSAWSVGSWSGWSDSPYYASSTSTYKREVNTRSVVAKTQYQYTHYVNTSTGNTSPIPYTGSGWSSTVHYCGETAGQTWLDYALTPTGETSNANGAIIYKGYCPTCKATKKFYNETSRPVYKTQYQYRDSNLVYTYYYYKWSDYTAWSDASISATADREVETRTLYRYRDKDVPQYANLTGDEDQSGEVYSFSGQLPVDSDVDLEGKLATIMVYKGKNSDPNESQLEYVGQTTIGAGNAYEFSFKTKEEPSFATGDFVVSLGIQGSTGLVNVGIINAPVPTYSVVFYDTEGNSLPVYDYSGVKLTETVIRDGKEIEVQMVDENGNAVTPEPPQIDGYAFTGWSGNTTNIWENTELVATFEEKTYAFVYVDWVNETVEVIERKLSDPSSEPGVEAPDGYTFMGWQENEEASTENVKILIAQYEVETHIVNFYNYDGSELLSSVTVEYGGVATPPDAPEIDGMTFVAWDTEREWWNVTHDMDVNPIYLYDSTAMMPVYDITYNYSGEEGSIVEESTVELSAEEGCIIYYTLDESEPSIESEVYTEPLVFDTATYLRAIAVAPDKNSSEIMDLLIDPETEVYQGTSGNYDEDTYEYLTEIGTVSVDVTDVQEANLRVELIDNPGLVEYLMLVECDRSVFYLDYDEETGLIYNLGKASENGVAYCTPYEDFGWEIHWYGNEPIGETGLLFELPLKVYDVFEGDEGELEDYETNDGSYDVKVSFSDVCTVASDETEVTADCFRVSVGTAESGQTVTVADYTNGAASITGIENSASYSGDTTFTVACEVACAVLCSTDGGETWTRLTGTAVDEGCSFSLDVDREMTVAVALKGDVTLDGELKNQDVTVMKAANLGKRSLTKLQEMVADVTGDGELKNQDVTKTKAALLGKTSLSWDIL